MTWTPAAPPLPLGGGQVHVWRARLGVEDDRLRVCHALLSQEESQRAARYAFDEPRRRFVVARGTLRAILAAYVGAAASDLVFAYGEHGKPRLTTPDTDTTFNLSHSGDRVLLAIARGRDVGVDVERTQRNVNWEAVSRRFFEGGEQTALFELPEEERRAAFFRCWTRKEAFMKATGRGVTYGLQSFSVNLAPEDPDLLWLETGSPEDWGLADADPDDEHAGAMCAAGRDWRPVYLTAPEGDFVRE